VAEEPARGLLSAGAAERGGGRAGGDPQGADGSAGDLLVRRELGARPEQSRRWCAQAQCRAQARVTPPSLAVVEGMSVVEVARQAGHAQTMTLAAYAHLIADLDGGERMSAEAAIRAAWEAEAFGKCPPQAPPRSGEVENPSVPRMGDPGLEPGTSSLSETPEAETPDGETS
jgi:hypothetical protein